MVFNVLSLSFQHHLSSSGSSSDTLRINAITTVYLVFISIDKFSLYLFGTFYVAKTLHLLTSSFTFKTSHPKPLL